MKKILKLGVSRIRQLFSKKFVVVGVPVIIVNPKKEILLGKRSFKQIFYPGFWGLPGGLVEFRESFEEAAKREVYEELGVRIKIIKQLENYEALPIKSFPIHAMNVPFRAKIINGKPKPKDETSEVKWFKPSEIKKMKLAYKHKEILKREKLI